MNRVRSLIVSAFCFGILLLLPALLTSGRTETGGSQKKQDQREQVTDIHRKWLEEDVVWIISDEERAVFSKLTSREEKDQFIEQFWLRRDPNPATPYNEFKEEHYRRIAYVNERYSSGAPGWRTDRGKVYIIHGPPDEIEKYTYGQTYQRRLDEGGGATSTLPFERWWYRHLDGLGSDIELEFVDPSGSGEFRLALNKWEKDALLFTPTGGPTIAESIGKATRVDHPYFQPHGLDNYAHMPQRAKDNPFIRYETYTMARAAPIVKYKDLQDLVEVKVMYDQLPFHTRQDYFQINEDQTLVPLTIELENEDLAFEVESGLHVARVALYGIVTSMTNRLITEFEDDLVLSYDPEMFEQGLKNRAVYQKMLPLSRKNRYKIDLAVRDLNSKAVGSLRQGIILPRYDEAKLGTSTIILSDYVRGLPEFASQDEMFVIGDMKVRPNVRKVFSADKRFWVYLHVYNVDLDQTTLTPSLQITYRIMKKGEQVLSGTDEKGDSVQFFAADRTVLIQQLPIQALEPGKYQVEVEILDRLGNDRITAKETFEIRS